MIYRMHQHSKQVESYDISIESECKLRVYLSSKNPCPVRSPQIKAVVHTTDSVLALNRLTSLIRQGFQGKNGPPGPPGVVGPQVRGSTIDILVDS